MLFNVMEMPKTVAILSHFDALSDYPEFHAELESILDPDRTKIIKYIVLMYDRNSPLKRIEDITERKIKGALLAGFRPKKVGRKKYFKRVIDDILKGYNHTVNRMIVRYCRIQGNMKYTLVVAGQEDFYQSIGDLMSRSKESGASESAARQKMFSEAEKNLNKLEQLRLELLNEDNNLLLKQELYQVIEEEDRRRLRISPESRLIKDVAEDEE